MTEDPSRRLPEFLGSALEEIPPASGAVVMGTGIVSVALALDHRDVLSLILLVLTAVIWVALTWLLPARAATEPERFSEDVGHPTALTSVAGTGVLGTRLALLGWDRLAAVLLVLALLLWAVLVPLVLRNWRTPTIGASFILTVATESLALLAAAVADDTHTAWLLYAALVPFCLGLCFYVFVLRRLDFRQLLVGSGAHWVTGGALAISTVAIGRIVIGIEHMGVLNPELGLLKGVTLVLWCLTMCWLPALVICEFLRPRLSYTVRRWSTVFPVGMCAACSFVVGPLTDTPGITTFARIWLWVAVAVWLVVFAAMLHSATNLVRSDADRAGAGVAA